MNVEDEIRVVWGVNSWVLVEAGGHGRPAAGVAPTDLAGLLLEAGLDQGRVDELASRYWRGRPAGAELPSETPHRAVWRSTGFSRMGTLILLAAAAIVFLLRVYGGR